MTARAAADASAEKGTVQDSITFLNDTLKTITVPAEKRSLAVFLGSLEEQAALYDDAQAAYAAAAAIAAGDAPGMMKCSSEQLVLDAVRCALCTGDWQTADSYLNSAVRNSPDVTIQAYIRLYSLWSSLCRVEDNKGMDEPVALLKTYAGLPSMEAVKPQLFFTLWYITGEDSWADALKKTYPASLETGIVNGTVQLLPAPFWYFVPHQKARLSDDISAEDIAVAEKTAAGSAGSSCIQKNTVSQKEEKRLQLGLFRERSNAAAFVQTLKEKGFTAYITTEKRASGTTYFIVIIDEDKKESVAEKLRSAGFECYEY